jgi:hypothetical protein
MVGTKSSVISNLFDLRPPSSLPIRRDVQDVLHEINDVDKNPMVLEVLDEKLLVVVAIVFASTVSIELLLLSDGRPF